MFIISIFYEISVEFLFEILDTQIHSVGDVDKGSNGTKPTLIELFVEEIGEKSEEKTLHSDQMNTINKTNTSLSRNGNVICQSELVDGIQTIEVVKVQNNWFMVAKVQKALQNRAKMNAMKFKVYIVLHWLICNL